MSVQSEVRTSLYNQAKGQNEPSFHFWSLEIFLPQRSQSHSSSILATGELFCVEPGSGVCAVQPMALSIHRAVCASQGSQPPLGGEHHLRET